VTPSYVTSRQSNRYNVQAACEYLIERGGAPAATAAALMTPRQCQQLSVQRLRPVTAPFPFILGLNSESGSEVGGRADVTAGLVLNSPFQNPYTQRLRMSVDWYQIQIDGAIGVPTFGQVYQECLDAQYNNLIGSTPARTRAHSWWPAIRIANTSTVNMHRRLGLLRGSQKLHRSLCE